MPARLGLDETGGEPLPAGVKLQLIPGQHLSPAFIPSTARRWLRGVRPRSISAT